MDLQKIEFLKGVKDFETVTEGYSGAEKFLFSKNGKRYFIKIGEFQTFENLEQILSDAHIPHPKIVEFGNIDETNAYIIEEFVDGKPLKYLLDDLDAKFVYEYGFRLGEKFRNLRKVFNDKPVDKDSSEKLFKHVNRRLCRLADCMDIYKDKLTQKQIEFLDYLQNFLKQNKNIIKNDIMVFGHNDIKPSNFLVDKKQINTIDLEGISYKIPALSLMWSFARADFKDDKNHAFANGWLDGLFNFDVPKSVLKSFNYVYLFNMCNYCEGYIKKEAFDKLDELITYITKNYFSNGQICLNKKFLKVATISDFKQLKGFEFSLKSGSYSPQNLTFKCQKENKTYFLKIMQTKKGGLAQILRYYQVLQDCGIPIPKIYGHGVCKGQKNCWVLFEYVDFPEIGKLENANCDVEKLGKKVAIYLIRLCGQHLENAKVFSVKEIDKEIKRLIKKCFENEKQLPYLKWTKSEILDFYNALIKNFENEKLDLIHDDVKCGNVLYDGKEKMVFVDNESLMISYQTINFQYMIKECFESKNVKIYQSFVKGYLKEFYGSPLPKRIEGQMKFLILLKLLRDCAGIKDKTKNSQHIDAMSKIFEQYVQNDEAIVWLR